jgi:hypothetical protein
MKDTKLIKALETLTKEEWGDWRKFLLMHTYETSEIYHLFTILQQKKNQLNNLETSEDLINKHFPKLSSKAFSNLMAKLYQLLESWLAINEMQASPYDEQLYLVKSLNKRGLFDQANYAANKLEQLISSNDKIDLDKSAALSILFHSQYYSDNPAGKILLDKLINAHCATYQDTSALYAIELVNWGGIANIDYNKELDILYQSCLHFKPSTTSSLNPAIKNIYLNSDVDAYNEVAEALYNGRFTFGSELHLVVTNYLEILSRKLFMKGKLENVQEVTKMQAYALEVFSKTGTCKIPNARFQNIVSTLSFMNSYEWTRQFIDEWIDKVETKNKEASKDLAYALNCFYHENYNTIMEYTRHTTYDDIYQKSRALVLQLIGLYYNRNENYDLFLTTKSNFNNFLKRNKSDIVTSTYIGISNLLNIIDLLAKKDFKKVEIDLNKYENIVYRSWVIKEVKQRSR